MPDDPLSGQTPLDVLGVVASSNVMLTSTLRHVEMYTMRGLLTLLWHEPAADSRGVGVVALGGAMGGLLGPGDALYQQLGTEFAEVGIPMIRASYRKPNDLDMCCVDAAAAVQLLVGSGADKVVLMGHSFGGAVAVRVGVGLPDMVAGVVTFATQSAGCEVAGGLAGRPLLLIHGDRDEILPVQASEVVRAIAGTGDLHVMPNDGHLLARSHAAIHDLVVPWVRQVLNATD